MDCEIKGSQILARQLHLEKAARRKFPWDPNECTLYMDIAPRQMLFACLTCSPRNSICYACGLRCHADHEIIELDTKRGYRCDCGTAHMSSHQKCSLRRTENDPDSNPNKPYGQNFDGHFCTCSESVNDESYGEGAMFQCLIGTRCDEDWFHARCIAQITRQEELQRQMQSNTGDELENDDEQEDELMKEEVRDEELKDEELVNEELGNEEEDEEYSNDDDEMSGDDLESTMPELPSQFGAVICPQCAQDVPDLVQSSAVLAVVNDYYFLTEDYGEIVQNTLPHLLHEHPFLDGKEESYLPEKDTDDSTLLEAGERALKDLPHENLVDGIQKFNNMKDSLMEYLKNVGKDGRVITRDDIDTFFNKREDI